jgi:hypothetical protein
MYQPITTQKNPIFEKTVPIVPNWIIATPLSKKLWRKK